MRKNKLTNQLGYSLFELVMVMIIISILMTASVNYMGNSVDVSKTEETKVELTQLSHSIVGNDKLISGSHRIDYGYVGDIGALPTSLSDLVVNPGLATWDGPYIKDDFYASSGSAESEYAIDGWGKTYSYAGGTTISSTGGSTTITKAIANTTSDLLYNSVSFNIYDLDLCPPGTPDKDSVRFDLTYPNGLGGYQTDSKYPQGNGYVLFDSIPIGQQSLSVIELKNNDTLIRKIHVNPKSLFHTEIQVPTMAWCNMGSSGGSVEILRPDGTGFTTQLLVESCTNNWECVNESISDGDGSYVRSLDNNWKEDLYSIENHTVGSGTVDSLLVYLIASGTSNRLIRTYIKISGVENQGGNENPPSSYTTYSTTYINNPNTGLAWTWSDVDALEAGVKTKKDTRITQVWVEVHYTN